MAATLPISAGYSGGQAKGGVRSIAYQWTCEPPTWGARRQNNRSIQLGLRRDATDDDRLVEPDFPADNSRGLSHQQGIVVERHAMGLSIDLEFQ